MKPVGFIIIGESANPHYTFGKFYHLFWNAKKTRFFVINDDSFWHPDEERVKKFLKKSDRDYNEVLELVYGE